jgi:hypothetical protein
MAILDLFAGKNLLGSWSGLLASLVLASLLVWLVPRPGSEVKGKVPASLPDWLPGVGNTYRSIFHNKDFLEFAR